MQRITLVLLAALLAACTGLASLETPKISFVGLRVVDAQVFEQRLELRLKVHNPNDMALPVLGLDLDVELEGEHFAHGVSARDFVVPAHGEAEFDMMVTANAATAILKLLGGDRKAREAVDYRISGKLATRIGMIRNIPFDERGTLPMGSAARRKP